MNVFSTVNFIKSKYISSIFNETLTVQMRCAVGNRFWAHRTKRTQNCHICSGSYDYMWKCYLGYLGLNYITKVNFTCFFFHLRVDPWTTQDELHRSFVCLFLNRSIPLHGEFHNIVKFFFKIKHTHWNKICIWQSSSISPSSWMNLHTSKYTHKFWLKVKCLIKSMCKKQHT